MNKTVQALLALACLGANVGGALADEAQLLQEGRGIPAKMMPKLLEVLSNEIAAQGHVGAIVVCRDKAPQMAKALSEQMGWQIRRVSLKNRNPKATPDEWERATLQEFEQRLAAGENPVQIDKGAVVMAEGKPVYRYMKALPTQDLCLKCHGTSDRIDPDAAAKIRELYPEDKAVGYYPAEIRGAITAKKPL